jgi:hypothetical protein
VNIDIAHHLCGFSSHRILREPFCGRAVRLFKRYFRSDCLSLVDVDIQFNGDDEAVDAEGPGQSAMPLPSQNLLSHPGLIAGKSL